MPFASIYPLYIEKVERKGHTEEELDQVLTWLTGYDNAGLHPLHGQARRRVGPRQEDDLHPPRVASATFPLTALPARKQDLAHLTADAEAMPTGT